MPLSRFALGALAALLACGCSQEEMVQKLASDEDRKVATQCIDTLRERNFDEIEARLDPSLKGANTRAALVQAADMIPAGKPSAVKLVGVQTQTGTDGKKANLTYQYSFGEQHLLINCATHTNGESRTIFGLTVKQLEAPLEAQSGFDLKGKSAVHYGVLILGLTFVLLSLVALIRCVTEENLRRKWLWVLFIIFGIGEFSMNWDSGEWTWSPLKFLLFSAGALASPYGPWEVSIALPLGAMVYLVRRFLNHRATSLSNDPGSGQI
jgi:hypothetical protein